MVLVIVFRFQPFEVLFEGNEQKEVSVPGIRVRVSGVDFEAEGWECNVKSLRRALSLSLAPTLCLSLSPSPPPSLSLSPSLPRWWAS